MELTANTTIGQILDSPEFSGFGRKLFQVLPAPFSEDDSRITLGALDRESPHADLISGLRRILELRQAGHPVYMPISPKKDEYLFFFPADHEAKCVFIVPGGGYLTVCGLWEGFPVAKRINELGYHAAVVNYRTGEAAHHPNPQDDLAASIRYVLDRAETLNLDPADYAVMGFSAGGHLAASFGVPRLGYEHYGLPKPGAMLLAYPVVTMEGNTHPDSQKMLLGAENLANQELIDRYSIEKQITPFFPKTYLWQCDRDNTVPIENSALLKDALDKQHVENIYETFSSEAHGWGIAAGQAAEGWVDRAVAFWQQSESSAT